MVFLLNKGIFAVGCFESEKGFEKNSRAVVNYPRKPNYSARLKSAMLATQNFYSKQTKLHSWQKEPAVAKKPFQTFQRSPPLNH